MNSAVHLDLIPHFDFLIVAGIDQPHFSASSWDRMRMLVLIEFASALRAASAPFVTCCKQMSVFCAFSWSICTYSHIQSRKINKYLSNLLNQQFVVLFGSCDISPDVREAAK